MPEFRRIMGPDDLVQFPLSLRLFIPATSTGAVPMSSDRFSAVFVQLRGVLQPYEQHVSCKASTPDSYYLEITGGDPKKPLFFGAVQRKKSYVSFHLFPVYMFPELLDDVSPGLRARMQGKSCFNFRMPLEDALHDELRTLTERGFEKFRAEKLISDART
jgi:hypothetical protein